MKNVFVIHSHTVFLTAMGVLECDKISHTDVLFLFTRGYKNTLFQTDIDTIDYSAEFDSIEKADFSNKHIRDYYISVVDSFLEKNIVTEFKLFVPHMAMRLCQIIYTNKLCINVSYLQEGAESLKGSFINKLSIYEKIRNYISNNYIHKTSRVWRTLGWFQPNTLSKQKEIHSYAINSSFFEDLPSVNHIVKWPSAPIKIEYGESPVFFIYDCYVAYGIISLDYYIDYCNKLIEKYAGANNWIKFHPAQKEEEKHLIENAFKKAGKKVQVCDNNIPMEIVMSNFKNLTFVGASSSLLKYAMDLGHKVYPNDLLFVHSKSWLKYAKMTKYVYMQKI